MTNKVRQTLFTAITISVIVGCQDNEGPCIQDDNGECIAGETGGVPPVLECAPFEDAEVGTPMLCQGEGTGWLVTEVYGAGDQNPLTNCLIYDGAEIPASPTTEDCGVIPLHYIPHDIANPTACCMDYAEEQQFIDTCELDCGYAAAKTAIAAIRANADVLVAPNPILEGAYEVAKDDLYALADFLETPMVMSHVASLVADSGGEMVSVGLGSGPSSPLKYGHIKDATLFLRCTLDEEEPYVPDPDNDECTEATHIPVNMGEQESQGIIRAGTITIGGADVELVSPLSDVAVSTREILTRDMSVEFTLKTFDTSIPDTAAGSFEFRDIELALAGPASGVLRGQTVTFAPGALRFAVTSTVLVDGVELFGGLPLTAEYGNIAPATAIRSLDGSFHFIEATFTSGEYTAVLATQPSVLVPIR